jgi:hypothetical protein
MQNEPSPVAMEEMVQKHRRLEKALDETAKALQSEKNSKTFWRCVAIVIACIFVPICLYKTKSKNVWLPVVGSPQMCVMMSDWWGLKVQTVYPLWRKPTGETKDYSEKWCIPYPDNTWRVFYSNDGGASVYNYPSTNFGTYF